MTGAAIVSLGSTSSGLTTSKPAAGGAPPGLSSAEAERRLIQFGPNELRREDATGGLLLFARQLASPVIWLLLGASLVSAALGELLDATAIGVIVVINAVIGFLQEHRAERGD
jgi:Ca2+-transporting ATPase